MTSYPLMFRCKNCMMGLCLWIKKNTLMTNGQHEQSDHADHQECGREHHDRRRQCSASTDSSLHCPDRGREHHRDEAGDGYPYDHAEGHGEHHYRGDGRSDDTDRADDGAPGHRGPAAGSGRMRRRIGGPENLDHGRSVRAQDILVTGASCS